MTRQQKSADFSMSCPVPIRDYPNVLLAHGGGGKLMHELIAKIFLAAFGNPVLNTGHDSAVIDVAAGRLAVTTDSFVVRPLFFPGGDIGSLAVYGTVNDLAMSGAIPKYLTAGFILEEGLPMETLWRVAQSMRAAADRVGVSIVTGDTKVVDKGKGDGIFINTAGIGIIEHQLSITPHSVRDGDAVIVSGDLGRHGIAIMAVREGLAFESPIVSDAEPLSDLVQGLLKNGVGIHCLRDLTRGGLASALHEIATTAHIGMEIAETGIPVREEVRGACEMLGLDPLYVANEGRCVIFVPAKDADKTLQILHNHPSGEGAAAIGTVTARHPGMVTLKSAIGAARILDILTGEQLPRIC